MVIQKGITSVLQVYSHTVKFNIPPIESTIDANSDLHDFFHLNVCVCVYT